VKYEIDKTSGYLRVDRPHRTSSLPPSLYGFVPQTYCGRRVGALMDGATDGDGDPLDICVLSGRPITRAEVILNARVVGIPMLDQGEADDKILAVLENEPMWERVTDLVNFPTTMLQQLCHYFSTYQAVPGEESNVSVGDPYDRHEAEGVVQAAIDDYNERFRVETP